MMTRATLLLLALLGACGDGERGQARATGNARARGALVAKVNGAAIGIEQVRELCASTGLLPRAALARLEEEQLLAAEAERRGYGRADSSDHEFKRALVQALLAETVERLRAEDIPLAEVRQRFDEVAPQSGLAPDSFGEHEPAVRAQLLLERQKAALEALTNKLRGQFEVKLSEPEVQKLLSDPVFWGESS